MKLMYRRNNRAGVVRYAGTNSEGSNIHADGCTSLRGTSYIWTNGNYRAVFDEELVAIFRVHRIILDSGIQS